MLRNELEIFLDCYYLVVITFTFEIRKCRYESKSNSYEQEILPQRISSRNDDGFGTSDKRFKLWPA